MPTSTLHPPQELLHYVAANRVLICKECRYAIQPSAIPRHLKELHRIYRSDRQEYIKYSESLDLASPEEVVLPKSHESPVPFLPTENGLVCQVDRCHHLCVSLKRMKSHWSTAHRNLTADPHVPQWSPVQLQTFFRGNQLKYFIVSTGSEPRSPPLTELEFDTESLCPSCIPPTVDISVAIESDWSADDLELLDNFEKNTSLDISLDPKIREMWQTVVPALARKHSFLKHGVLAISALHRAYIDPSQKQRYQVLSAWHQDKALPEFRDSLEHPTEETCHALLASCQLLIFYCFASEEQDEGLLLVKGIHESGLPDWLQVIRNSCSVFGSLMHLMLNGPLKLFVLETKIAHIETLPADPKSFQRLQFLLGMPNFGELSDSTAGAKLGGSPLPVALLELATAFAKVRLAHSQNTFNMWTVVHIWPARVSMEFLELLRNRDPGALVLLAHYCILLKPLESHWYMNGFTKRLLTRIYNQLDPSWRKWLQWPLEEIGLQD